ncbi:MAG: maltose alpha-D-glucosyltransferase [Acidobacteriaceae bacterium]
MKRKASASDPLWYKDAIIYELHVRAFADSNNDGIGDFPGLMQKLDYLQDLGITCIWLLPFFPSPLRDDGYDISDYLNVHPNYGTMEQFQEFLDAAHDRGLQVMIELVINHTSDQHPWFQAARHAPPGSVEREFYVWNDNDQKYRDARIIFTDTEKSNWTYDPVAQSYFWHRFFSHQPDLNYDNPKVLEEVLKVMRFWLDKGVDALRIDAIPYLVEREGTSCENLPETHAVIRKIRAAIDADYADRLILAEANQWPSDVLPYFGDGDECHMAFHFPLMPRIYMALRQEDRLPITEIMAQTPEIPESCQWGLFLRNHDELTLEMVTDDERDYMYLAYSSDPRMRVNIGIRRRLAPLVDNNRRRIELLNSLLFSFPGTPIMYYGDEIGMGDNIYLGDRNGVRTPMQWTADRNAGFSRAVPAKLYSPVIMDPIWGYQVINVEAQQSDQSSLLHWMRNMIALRKLFKVFGRGMLKFLNPVNRKALAYIRQYDGETILCVANLSRFAQPVSLDLSEFDGMLPVEMLGYVYFPVITKQPYSITLSPYAFLWLELQPAPEIVDMTRIHAEEPALEYPVKGWQGVLSGPGKEILEKTLLPEFLPKQRWFGAKTLRIASTRITEWTEISDTQTVMLIVQVKYVDATDDYYSVPLAASFGQTAEEIRDSAASAVLAFITSTTGPGILHDALYRKDVCTKLLQLIASNRSLSTQTGTIYGKHSSLFDRISGDASDELPVRKSTAEQSNSSVLYGNRLILKLFRRLEAGPNPDAEIGHFLTETAHFDRIAPFCGTIEYQEQSSGEQTTLGLLQGLVENEGDGWQWTLEELQRYYEDCAAASISAEEVIQSDATSIGHFSAEASPLAKEYVGMYLDAAFLLGQRTGEMHAALATPTNDEAFKPELWTPEDLHAQLIDLENQAKLALEALRTNLYRLPDDAVEMAGLVLSRRTAILNSAQKLAHQDIHGFRIRIHGDYHLGQILRVKNDYVILDFEGEPARSMEYRRRKSSPLKDVAGMLRSYSYAAFAALQRYTTRRPEHIKTLEPWAQLWERSTTSAFLRGYMQVMEQSPLHMSRPEDMQQLLKVYLLEKALYELLYELNNRPTWAYIPLAGILSLPVEK